MRLSDNLNDPAIHIGISGTIASVTSAGVSFLLHDVSAILGFVGAAFSALSGILTFCLILRKRGESNDQDKDD